MARPRASDHEDKRQAILEQSANLFAAHGYDRASLTMLARRCGMSKALFYHYYSEKSEVLFDIIRTHIEHLLKVTGEVSVGEKDDPHRYLLRMSEVLLEVYRTSDTKHHVQINQLHLLPRRQQKIIKDMERKLVDRFSAAISPCVPVQARTHALLKPITMSLFGMLNWNYLWFRESGQLSRRDYAKLAVTVIIDGTRMIGSKPERRERHYTLQSGIFDRS